MTDFIKTPVDLARGIFDFLGTSSVPGTDLANAVAGSTYRNIAGGSGSMIYQKTTGGWEALSSNTFNETTADGLYGRLAVANTWAGTQILSAPLATTQTGSSATRYVSARAVCHYRQTTTTGAIVFKTAISSAVVTGVMVSLRIVGHFYSQSIGPVDLSVMWYRTSAFQSTQGWISRGVFSPTTIRVGLTPDGFVALIFGDVADSFTHPNLEVDFVGLGHSGAVQAMLDGWTVTQETDLSLYTELTTVTEKSLDSNTLWSAITGKPTTIGGYGITDFNSLGDARWSLLAHTHTFASLTSKPTTIGGYGITDFNSLGDARWGRLSVANTWSALQSFSAGLTVSAGTITLPSASIADAAHTANIARLATAQSWTALQSMTNGPLWTIASWARVLKANEGCMVEFAGTGSQYGFGNSGGTLYGMVAIGETAGETHSYWMSVTSTAVTFNGVITANQRLDSYAQMVSNWTGQTTNYQFADAANTGAYLRWGIERSTGGALFAGSSAYASVLGTENTTSLELGTNGNIRFKINSSGSAFFLNTLDVTGVATFAGGLTISGGTLNDGTNNYAKVRISSSAPTTETDVVGTLWCVVP